MENNRLATVTVRREQLYEQIWNTPTTKVAKTYGLSDVMLTKICKKYHIPKPPRGYWAKLHHGHRISRPPLPEIDDQLQVVEIHKRPESTLQKGTTPEKPNEPRIHVAERLVSPHPLVKQTLEILKTATADGDGILRFRKDQCLDVSLGKNSIRRSMLLMNAFIKVLDARGYSVSIGTENNKWATYAKISNEKVRFRLRELLDKREITPAEKKQHEQRSWLYRFAPYVYFPSGRLVLSIEEYGEGLRCHWSDGKRQKIEGCLRSFIAGLVNIAEKLKARDLRIEQQRQEWAEQERRRHEEEQRRLEEQSKIREMESMMVSWEKSQRIRRFVSAVEEAVIQKRGRLDPNSQLSHWLSWVRRYADSIDPIALSFKDESKSEVGDRGEADRTA